MQKQTGTHAQTHCLVGVEGFEPTHHYRTDLQSAAALQLDSTPKIFKHSF